jgi:hypothetical protein
VVADGFSFLMLQIVGHFDPTPKEVPNPIVQIARQRPRSGHVPVLRARKLDRAASPKGSDLASAVSNSSATGTPYAPAILASVDSCALRRPSSSSRKVS